MTFCSLTPMLHTQDMIGTISWYETVLGFNRVGEHSDDWCRLERDGVAVMFMSNAHFGAPHAPKCCTVCKLMHEFADSTTLWSTPCATIMYCMHSPGVPRMDVQTIQLCCTLVVPMWCTPPWPVFNTKCT